MGSVFEKQGRSQREQKGRYVPVLLILFFSHDGACTTARTRSDMSVATKEEHTISTRKNVNNSSLAMIACGQIRLSKTRHEIRAKSSIKRKSSASRSWFNFRGLGSSSTLKQTHACQRTTNRYNLRTQTRGTLLSYCTYVQWVPDSDVVVAQNRGALCVWYNIHAPDQARARNGCHRRFCPSSHKHNTYHSSMISCAPEVDTLITAVLSYQ